MCQVGPVEPHAAEAVCVRRSVAIVRPWSYTSWVAFTVLCKSLATSNRRHDGAPAAGSTQLLLEPPRRASPPAAQPLVVPPPAEEALVKLPLRTPPPAAQPLAEVYALAFQHSLEATVAAASKAAVAPRTPRTPVGARRGGSLHLVHTLHSVAYIYYFTTIESHMVEWLFL